MTLKGCDFQGRYLLHDKPGERRAPSTDSTRSGTALLCVRIPCAQANFKSIKFLEKPESTSTSRLTFCMVRQNGSWRDVGHWLDVIRTPVDRYVLCMLK